MPSESYIPQVKIKRYNYKCAWYCAKCGVKNTIAFGGILDAFRDKTSTREWAVKALCENCGNPATVYRDELSVKAVSQLICPIEVSSEEEDL